MKLKKVPVQALILVLLIGFTAYLIFPGQFQTKNQTSNPDQIQKTAQEVANTCSASSDKYTCYQGQLAEVAKEKDLIFAEKTLDLLQNIDPSTRSCHVLAHRIAEAATKKDPSKWQQLISQVNVSSCGAGYLHGILEAHTSTQPDFKVTPETINDLCKEGASDRKRMCSHYLAHILVLQNDGNADKSVSECAKVTDELKFECLDGVFMEKHQKNIMVDHQLAKPPTFDPSYTSSLEKGCNILEGLAASACWTEMAEIFAKAYGYEQGKIYDNCYQAPTQELGRQCYLKGVVVLTTYPDYDSAEKLVGVCKPYSGKVDYGTCVSYMISSLMNYSINFTDRAIKLCSNIEDRTKEGCFKNLGALLKINTDLASREKLCQDAPDQYKRYCIST